MPASTYWASPTYFGARGCCRVGATYVPGSCASEHLPQSGGIARYALPATTPISLLGLARAEGWLAARDAPRVQGLPEGAGEDAFVDTTIRTRALAFAGGKLYWGPLGPAETTIVSGSPGAAAPDADPFVSNRTCATSRPPRAASSGPPARLLPKSPTDSIHSKPLSGGSVVLESDNERAPEWIDADAERHPRWIDVETNEFRRRSAVPPGPPCSCAGREKCAIPRW